MLEKWKLPSPAMAVSWVALAVALGGTAVAATATLVKLTDNSGTQIADIDGYSRLRVAASPVAPMGSFSTYRYLYNSSTNTLLGPTKASLVLSTISVSNYYDQTNGAPVRVVVSILESTAANCASYVSSQIVGVYSAAAGQTFQGTYPAGVVMRPKVSTNYVCLTATMSLKGSPSGYYLPEVVVTGFVEGGSFTAPAFASAAEADGAPRRSR